MGQYHMVVNLDKRQFLYSHAFGDGLKLREFGNSAGGMATGLVYLLAASNGRGGGDISSESEVIGSWAGDRIAIMGDYAEDTDIPSGLDPEPSSIYARCLHRGEEYPEHVTPGLPTYRDISADVRAAIAEVGDFTYKVEKVKTRYLDGTVTERDYVTRHEPGSRKRIAALTPDMIIRGG